MKLTPGLKQIVKLPCSTGEPKVWSEAIASSTLAPAAAFTTATAAAVLHRCRRVEKEKAVANFAVAVFCQKNVPHFAVAVFSEKDVAHFAATARLIVEKAAANFVVGAVVVKETAADFVVGAGFVVEDRRGGHEPNVGTWRFVNWNKLWLTFKGLV